MRRRAGVSAGDHHSRRGRAGSVFNAVARTLAPSAGSGVGLRGGTFSHDLNAGQNGIAATLDGVRFAGDVAVGGAAGYLFETESIDATITVDGPAGEDGTLHVTGVWFASSHEATRLEITGELAGRTVALRVLAV